MIEFERGRSHAVRHIWLDITILEAKLGGRVVGVETSDKMTDPQIVAKVRGHYLDQGSATSSR